MGGRALIHGEIRPIAERGVAGCENADTFRRSGDAKLCAAGVFAHVRGLEGGVVCRKTWVLLATNAIQRVQGGTAVRYKPTEEFAAGRGGPDRSDFIPGRERRV